MQEESPFKASREFGISYMTSKGECVSIGTVMRIQDFAKVGNDGQMLISNTGDGPSTLNPTTSRQPRHWRLVEFGKRVTRTPRERVHGPSTTGP